MIVFVTTCDAAVIQLHTCLPPCTMPEFPISFNRNPFNLLHPPDWLALSLLHIIIAINQLWTGRTDARAFRGWRTFPTTRRGGRRCGSSRGLSTSGSSSPWARRARQVSNMKRYQMEWRACRACSLCTNNTSHDEDEDAIWLYISDSLLWLAHCSRQIAISHNEDTQSRAVTT